MKQNFFVYILLPIVFGACSKEIKKPEGLIPADTMVFVAADLHLIESMKTHGVLPDVERDYSAYVKGVFTKYKMNESRYKTSIEYYNSQPQELLLIYEKVLELYAQKEIQLKKELKDIKEKNKE